MEFRTLEDYKLRESNIKNYYIPHNQRTVESLFQIFKDLKSDYTEEWKARSDEFINYKLVRSVKVDIDTFVNAYLITRKRYLEVYYGEMKKQYKSKVIQHFRSIQCKQIREEEYQEQLRNKEYDLSFLFNIYESDEDDDY